MTSYTYTNLINQLEPAGASSVTFICGEDATTFARGPHAPYISLYIVCVNYPPFGFTFTRTARAWRRKFQAIITK